MSAERHIAYELRGKSLEAAQEIDARIRIALHADPVAVNGRNLLDIHNDYQARYRTILAAIRKEKPELLRLCGLYDAALQVETDDGAHPRAYQNFPAIYPATAKAPMYLMFCPVDYKGDHFRPVDAVQCDDADFFSTDMGHAIYKKRYWLAEAPLIDGGRRGVALPADFNPQTSHTIRASGLRPELCLRAGAQTQKTLAQYEANKELFSKTWRAFTDAAQAWTSATYPNHHMGFMMGADKRLEIHITGDGGFGKQELNHPDWIVEQKIIRPWRNPQTGVMEDVDTGNVYARPNPATATGKKLADLYDAIPKMPQSRDHAELAVTSDQGEHFPVVHHFPQGTYLAYHGFGDKPKIIAIPADCTRVDPAELTWLDRDRNDRSFGIVPPPPPAALAHLYPAQTDPRKKPRGPQP